MVLRHPGCQQEFVRDPVSIWPSYGHNLSAEELEVASRFNPLKALAQAFKEIHMENVDSNHGENFRSIFESMNKSDLIESAIMLSSDAWMWKQRYINLLEATEGCEKNENVR